jgi:hypothetical protein
MKSQKPTDVLNGLANYIHDTVLSTPIADSGFGLASIEQVRETSANEIRRDLLWSMKEIAKIQCSSKSA